MLNLIRMNLFRMVHTKSAIVVFAVLMLMTLISSCMTADDSREMAKQIQEEQKAGKADKSLVNADNGEYNISVYETGEDETDEMPGDFGIYVNSPVKSDGTLKDYLYIYCSELSSGLLVLFILIGAVLFFRGDEKNGFIKNIAGQAKHKYNIFFSKLVVIGIYTFICMFCCMIAGYIAFRTGLALEDGINFGIKYLPEAAKVFALQYLLHMAFISGLLLITEVTRSTAAGITIGSFGIMGFGRLLVVIVQKVFNTEFDISKYYINTNISKVNMDAGQDIINFALGIGIVYFIVYNVLNVLWFSKKDIV